MVKPSKRIPHKQLHFIYVLLGFIILSACSTIPIQAALEQYDDQNQLKTQTLATPVLSGSVSSALALESPYSIYDLGAEMRFDGDLQYEKLDEEGFRIQLNKSREAASISWLFPEKMDFTNRWFQIRYSGIAIPKKVGLSFDTIGGKSTAFVFSASHGI